MYKNMKSEHSKQLDLATVSIDDSSSTILLRGEWNWVTIDEKILTKLVDLRNKKWVVDATLVKHIDTAGIYFIHKILAQFKQKTITTPVLLLSDEVQKLFDLTAGLQLSADSDIFQVSQRGFVDWVVNILKSTWHTSMQLLSFFGHLCYTFATLYKRGYSIYRQGIVETIASAGIRGFFISSSLCFLIGVNLTYQMAPQFVTYGANIYVVNFLGISLLREVTPLLTAIIVAGRTGSAITASIGTMQVQEEIDALKTMGISPMRRLVVPKVIGLAISLPILTMLADVASMLGGMIFAGPLLGVNPGLFLDRLQSGVSINNFWIGIFKSFFFAWIVGMVGCYCGFKVKANAESVGVQTTRSVVISICLIIVIDALFAILFKLLGLK